VGNSLVEHPDFDLVDLRNNRFELKADENKLHLLENFTEKFGSYEFDERFRIPLGSPRKDKLMRRLVGNLVARGDDYLGLLVRTDLVPPARQDIIACVAYCEFGVALF
jgi:hypothetical protein